MLADFSGIRMMNLSKYSQSNISSAFNNKRYKKFQYNI